MTILHEIKKKLDKLTYFTQDWRMDYTTVDVSRIVFGPNGRIVVNFRVIVALEPHKDEPSKNSSDM